MLKNLNNIKEKEITYRNRIMVCLIIAELIVIGFVELWPAPDNDPVYQDIVYSDNAPQIRDITITEQQSSPPPPPRPQIPVEVPNDEVIEEEEIEMTELDLSEYSDSLATPGIGEMGNADQVVANPQLPPTVTKIVEPTLPNMELRWRIHVTFLVNRDGSVEEANLSKIEIYDDETESYEVVRQIDNNIIESVIAAALQWKFRPAKDRDAEVKSYTTHTFTLGGK